MGLTDSPQHEQGDAAVLGLAFLRSASEVQRGVEHRQAQGKEHHAADQKQRSVAPRQLQCGVEERRFGRRHRSGCRDRSRGGTGTDRSGSLGAHNNLDIAIATVNE